MTSPAPEPKDVTAPATARPGLGRRLLTGWRSIPVLVRAATGAFAGLMLAMMFLYPANYGFDEPQHFDMAYSYAQGHGKYGPGERKMGLGVVEESHRYARGYPPKAQFADRPIAPRDQRKSIEQLGDDRPSTVPNQMVQHPPLYYLLGAGILNVPGVSSLHYDVQFALLRLLSLLLLLPLPWLCYAIARRIGTGGLAPAASLVPLLFPALARSGASVNNDALMTLACGVVLYLIVKVVTGDTSRRTALWMAGWLVVALLSKGFALVVPVLTVLAYLVAKRRYGVAVLRQVAIVGAGTAVGAVWWIHNKIAYGAVQPDGFGSGYTFSKYLKIHPGPERGNFPDFVHELWTSLLARFWGSIGLIESPDYNWTFSVIGTVVLAFLIGVALFHGLGGRYGRLALVVPLLMGVLTLGLLVKGPWRIYHRFVLLPGAQGRYLYPVIPVLAAVALLGLGYLVRERWQRFVAPALVLCAAYAQLWTLRTVVHAWWITDQPVARIPAWRNALHSIADWAPWPVGVTVLIGLGILALVARLVVVAALQLRTPAAVPAEAKLPEPPATLAVPANDDAAAV